MIFIFRLTAVITGIRSVTGKQLWSGVFFVCGKKYIGVTLLSVVRYFMKCDDQLSTDGNASDVDKGQTGYHHLMPDLGEKVGSYI